MMKLISVGEMEEILGGESAEHILAAWPDGYRQETLFETEVEGGIWPFDDFDDQVRVHAVWQHERGAGFLWCEAAENVSGWEASPCVLSGFILEEDHRPNVDPAARSLIEELISRATID